MDAMRVTTHAEVGGCRLEVRDADGRTLATARLAYSIGLDVPRYWFHVGCMVLAAAELRLFHRQRTLLLCNDHTGAAELRDVTLDAAAGVDAARGAVRRLVGGAVDALRDAASAGHAVGSTLIVELPGIRAAAARAPFWDALGRHFYSGDPDATAARVGPEWRTHVAALLPRDPLLVSFLTPEAQAALGQPAPAAAPLAAALAAAGLHPGGYVTIDEGGPVYECTLDVSPARPAD
jgi:arginine N-succinyltransferase